MKEFTIQSPVDSLELSCIITEPAEGAAPKGIVQLAHGMCEHKERYIPFMEFLSGNGYVCVIHDHRGHGASVRTSADLGYMGRGGWSALIEDAKAVSDYARGRYPALKLHLLGHSMGSLVVRGYAKRYDGNIDSLFVIGCPSDNPAKGAGKVLSAVIGTLCGWHHRSALLQRMSFGAYASHFPQDVRRNAWVCSDSEALDAYNADPLCQFVFTADGFHNLLSLMQYCYDPKGWAVENPAIPVHFLSGALDPCRISDRALQQAVGLMKDIGYKSTDLQTYPDMRHEILNETCRQTVWNDILKAIEKV